MQLLCKGKTCPPLTLPIRGTYFRFGVFVKCNANREKVAHLLNPAPRLAGPIEICVYFRLFQGLADRVDFCRAVEDAIKNLLPVKETHMISINLTSLIYFPFIFISQLGMVLGDTPFCSLSFSRVLLKFISENILITLCYENKKFIALK